jgi:hypothetical protein
LAMPFRSVQDRRRHRRKRQPPPAQRWGKVPPRSPDKSPVAIKRELERRTACPEASRLFHIPKPPAVLEVQISMERILLGTETSSHQFLRLHNRKLVPRFSSSRHPVPRQELDL